MMPTRIVPRTLIASMGVDRRQLVAAHMRVFVPHVTV